MTPALTSLIDAFESGTCEHEQAQFGGICEVCYRETATRLRALADVRERCDHIADFGEVDLERQAIAAIIDRRRA